MMHTYRCEMDLALTYALRRPRLARQCAQTALSQAILLKRPDLAYAANERLGLL